MMSRPCSVTGLLLGCSGPSGPAWVAFIDHSETTTSERPNSVTEENFASGNAFVNTSKNCLPLVSFDCVTLDHDTLSDTAPKKSASDLVSNARLIVFAI